MCEKTLVAEIAGNKKALLNWIKHASALPEHIGELRKRKDGYIYFTTIGLTFFIQRARA